MALVTGRELLAAADAGGYAVGAFNCHTLEMIPAVVQAAEEERSPVLLQFTAGSIGYMGADVIAALVRHLAARVRVPVGYHLDHGSSLEQALLGIRHGFTSVMIDGSHHPFEANVSLTRQVVLAARAAGGVSVEGEIGRLSGAEDELTVEEREAALTRPEDAAEFAAATEVDYLAVAFGTAHGFYRGEPKLDFDRLAAIRAAVRPETFLVMHGGSGLPDAQVRRAIELGARKINVATELKDAWARALRETLAAKPDEIDPRRLLGPAREAVKTVVRQKMRLFGSSGRAWEGRTLDG